MTLFYIILIFLMFGVFVKPQKQNLYIFISFIVLFIISAFRDKSVGTDSLSYERIFSNIERGNEVRHEIGWQVLNKLIVFFGGSYETLIIVTSLLVLLPVFFVAKKYSKNPMLTIFLFYSLYLYLQSFNIVRQTIAISISLLAIYYLLNNKKILFYALILIASTFHLSALILLPLAFLHRLPNTNIFYILAILLSIVLGLGFTEEITRYVIVLLKYESYLDDLNYELRFTHFIYYIINNIFFFFILYISQKKDILFKLFFVSFFVGNILGFISFSYRVNLFFIVGQLLYFPYLIYDNKIKQPFLLLLLIIIYAFITFYMTLGSGGVFPYLNRLF